MLIVFIGLFSFGAGYDSYTEKTTPEDTDILLILDKTDNTTKKVKVGNLPSNSVGGEGVNWSSYSDLTTLSNSDEFIINNSGTNKSLNWESFQGNIETGWTDNGTVVYNKTTTDFVGIGTSNPTANLEIRKTGSNRYLRISSAPDLDGNVMQINSSGNVGIGTINFAGKLWVASNSLDVLTVESLYPSSNSAGALLDVNTNDGAAMSSGDNIGTIRFNGANDGIRTMQPTAQIRVSATDDWGSAHPSSIQFWTAAQASYGARMTINENGNVGIGTERPSSRFEVIKSSVVTTAPLLMASSTVSSKGDYMIIGSAGNVGIGTINPISKLEVNGLITPDKVTADPCTSGQEGAIFYNDTSNYWCGCNGTDDVKLTDNTTACF